MDNELTRPQQIALLQAARVLQRIGQRRPVSRALLKRAMDADAEIHRLWPGPLSDEARTLCRTLVEVIGAELAPWEETA